MKVSQIVYTRPDKQAVLDKLNELRQLFDNAKSVEEFLAIHEEYKAYSIALDTNMRIAFIRFTQDTRDEFYAAEKDYLDEIGPEISVANAEVARGYLTSPFRSELEKRFPRIMFVNLQMGVDAADPRIVEDRVEENKVTTAYTKLMSGITIDFDGEKLTMAGIGKYFTSPDRDLRKRAVYAWGQAIEDNKQQLDEIYDKLVKIRTRMGRKLGYEGFAPLGYLQMQRNCYNREDIAKFHASRMYNEMSEETGKLFDTMRQSECFDVMSREGKWGGGYCEGLPEYKLPFILANWNGSAGDVDVLTHEFGHALEFYKSFFIDSEFLSSISMETAEVHSMSMEFLAYPWIDLFFGDKTPEYKFYHIGGAVTFIPYGTIVDCFQQTCYDNPDMTPAERNAFYNKLEKEFLPHMTTEGIPALQDGRRWQRQAHIFESPFYYIDYCFAQFTALQFLALSQQDYKGAFDKYIKFLNYGGTKPFTELLGECDLLSPFEEDSFKLVVSACEKILGL